MDTEIITNIRIRLNKQASRKQVLSEQHPPTAKWHRVSLQQRRLSFLDAFNHLGQPDCYHLKRWGEEESISLLTAGAFLLKSKWCTR